MPKLVVLNMPGSCDHREAGAEQPTREIRRDFVDTEFGQGLRLLGVAPQGINWARYKISSRTPSASSWSVPTDTFDYRRLFRYDDELDEGWYYGDHPLRQLHQYPDASRCRRAVRRRRASLHRDRVP